MSAGLLIILGGIIGIGFLGNILFEKTKVPDVLFLIGVGVILGPVFNVITPESVRPFMSAFGTVALTIILFEGGLDLDLKNTFRHAGRALILVSFSFFLTTFFVYYAMVLGLNATGWMPLALAAAVSCTSTPIVISVLGRLMPGSPMLSLLAVESAVSEALAVLTVLAFIGLDQTRFDGVSLMNTVGYSLLVGGGIALVSGAFWLWLLSRLSKSRFFYVMTVGFVFLLMGGVEGLLGSGAFAVLIFGLILGNGDKILHLFPSRLRDRLQTLLADGSFSLQPRITESHAEISFLIRSFFFVYLGIIFRWPGSDTRMWLTIVLVLAAILVGREIAVQLTGWTTGIPARQRIVLGSMVPRGLATTILSGMVLSRAGAPAWETLAVFVVVLTNTWMAIRITKLPGTVSSVKMES